MTLFNIAPVSEQPDDKITSWSIREVLISSETEKTHHLVGYIPYEGCGRVTSKIQSFDKQNRLITTNSGRIYLLEGQPGKHEDGEYVWHMWSLRNEAQDEVDVSAQYC